MQSGRGETAAPYPWMPSRRSRGFHADEELAIERRGGGQRDGDGFNPGDRSGGRLGGGGIQGPTR